jgi:transposase-like protein
MNITNLAYHRKINVQLVCSDCGAPGQGSCKCGAPYVSPGERAEAAVKANPEKSDRVIAEELGINHNTVNRARKKTTVSHETVEKRTGKDGKKRKSPVRKTSAEKFDAVAQARRRGKTQTEAAKDAGLTSVQSVKISDAYQQGRTDLLAELGVDSQTLAPSAQAKLETAKRQIQRALDEEHVKRMRELDEEVRQRVLAETKEYLAMLKARETEADRTIAVYKEFAGNHRFIFTVDEYKEIEKVLHPDNSASDSVRASAFSNFRKNIKQLRPPPKGGW